MRRLGCLALLVLASVGLVAIVAGSRLAILEISARPEPPSLEARLARAARHRLIPARARALPNPIPPSPEVLDGGLAHFADHCAGCHGNDGKGQTMYGTRMFPRAPDMAAEATQSLSDGELFWIIENGIRWTGMPGFGDEDPANDDESWQLVHFLRRLPDLSAEELAEMERLNPTLTRADVEREREIERFLAGEASVGAAHDH